MSRFADIRTEWRVADIERELKQKADCYEVYSLCRDVANLEREARELRSICDELRSRLEACESKVNENS